MVQLIHQDPYASLHPRFVVARTVAEPMRINGMANSAVAGSMSTLDPQLGSAYKPASAATGYSVNANAFGTNQTVFNAGGASTQQGAQTAPATSVQPQASQQPTEPQSFTSWAAGLFN